MTVEPRSVLHYSIVGRLGAGGMGVVYRAVDTRLDRPVALKFLPDGLVEDPQAKQRLLLEAKAAAHLDHPNIGVVYGIEEVDERLFIVMALYEGQTVQQRLASGPVPVEEAAALCLQVLRGIGKAHEAGIVHRDLKPANLFLTGDGLVKILDFGLVKRDVADGLTRPGTILGTPEYMAPEQVRGSATDARVDLWSVGVVLYEMLTGVSPFRADTVPATILAVMSAEPAPLSGHGIDGPDALQEVIERALSRDPDARYATARAFALDLEGALDLPSGARPAVASPTTVPTGGSITDVTIRGAGTAAVSALLEPVPRARRFVGRREECHALDVRLDRDRIVAVRGMAGEGKSLLVAQVVLERFDEDRVCWFTFDPVEKNSVDALYWSVGAFLATHGESLLWRYLQGEIEAHRPLDRTVRLNLLLSSLAAVDCAFCFDDVHLVAGAPEVVELLRALQRLFASDERARGSAIAIVGRAIPTELEHVAVTVTGLRAEDVAELAAAFDVELPDRLLRRLHERTLGNPTLLELALAGIASMAGDVDRAARFIESMAGEHDIRDFVVNHLYDALEEDEQRVLGGLSIFPAAVELEVAEEVLARAGIEGITRHLHALVKASIVQEADKDQIRPHELVREFCYRQLESRIKRQLHAYAADHYEASKKPLQAAYHAARQGDPARALELLSTHQQAIIHSGGAASMLDLLDGLDTADLDDEQRFAYVLVRAEALTIAGEYHDVRRLFEEAVDDAFEEIERAELLCRLASTCNHLGEHERAIDHARASLDAFEAAGEVERSAASYRAMGMGQFRLGRLDEARAAFSAGLEHATTASDRGLQAYLDQYLGLVDIRQGRLDEARVRLDRSRRAFRTLRDRGGEAEALGNLAAVHHLLGDHDRERALNQKVLEIAEEVGDVGYLLILYNNVAHGHVQTGACEQAIEQYEHLVALAQRIDHRPWHGAGLVGLAECHYSLGSTDVALEYATAAHDLLHDERRGPVPSIELAMSQRVLGEIHLAMGDRDAARTWFEASLPTFEQAHETEEFERARRGLEAARA